jgi:vacuolar-type H+-ATPase subunit H
MLNIQKKVILTGKTMIDEKQVLGYQANIDSDNPINMTINRWATNKNLYKENRELCRKEEAEFEDAAYALQDEMLNAKEE